MTDLEKLKATIIFERMQSDYLHADSIRIYGIFTCEKLLENALSEIKPYEEDMFETREIQLNKINILDLNIWKHDDE